MGESVVLRQLSFFGATPRNTLDLKISQRERNCVATQISSRLTELGEALASSLHRLRSLLRFTKSLPMSDLPNAARMLATAFLRGVWSPEELLTRGRLVLLKRQEEERLRSIVSAVVERFGAEPPVPRWQKLAEFLAAGQGRRRPTYKLKARPHIGSLDLPPHLMQPVPTLADRALVPAITTESELAEWLGLTVRELDWFADVFGHERRTPEGPLRHYRYRLLKKRSGRLRLLEVPKPRLKQLQRRILHDILDAIPPHPATHAFRPGRSVLSYVAPHAGRDLLLHVDLREFFPSISAARVDALFHTVGYPERVAHLLTGFCTNAAPEAALIPDDQTEIGSGLGVEATSRLLYRSPHLPQGAPTSPALANLCAYRLDVRLSALAERFEVSYSRYADDLLFSGDHSFERGLTRFRVLVCAIAINEGFFIRARKTRVLPASVSQRVAGVVLNAHPNPPRRDFDDLKAQLYNCICFGAASQNRDARPNFRQHLQGRIGWMASINDARGRKLQDLFDQIEWTGKRDGADANAPSP